MKKLLLLSVIAILFSSCLPFEPMPYYIDQSRQKENRYYIPSASTAPLLSKKNDLAFSINHGMANRYRSVDVQGSYLATDHLGITATISSPTRMYDIRFPKSEVAVGYVIPLKNNWHFETYGGAGTGKIENHHATGNSRMKCNQIFIQPAIATQSIDDNFKFAIVSRFTNAGFKFIDSTFSNDRESYSAKQISILRNEPHHLFWEPGFSLRLGVRNLLFNVNYTTSAHLGKTNFERGKDNFSIGLTYKFNAAIPNKILLSN